MMRRWPWTVLLLLSISAWSSGARPEEQASQNSGLSTPAGPEPAGPETEERFPPLVVPDGFQATLFACDPLIEYPSVIALGPGTGSLFLAHDYMTGLGVEIVRRDEVRLIVDTDADGYADDATVYAGEFNSIQGLAYYDGNVFVMHAPLLTRLRDTNGDGVADERLDLIEGLGLPPEENDNRLHCANGVVAGHDGWLYLALGDRGCNVQRPEGDRLLYQQGGILRCRADGSDLHVFATGLRNIYDVALDEELNVFVRDNENDGGDYMIRACHCFFGSDHGYPYHYYERPDEPMPPLADLGRGSSAGGTSYLETAFPADYRDSLFFCEWGRGVVRYRRTRRSSSFEPMTEIDFATGATDDPYGFKPTDLVVDRDGSLLISDWCDGQRPKRGRGRIYRVSNAESAAEHSHTIPGSSDSDTKSLIRQLDADSYHRRVAAQLEIQRRGVASIAEVVSALEAGQLKLHARLHAIWIIARAAKDTVPEVLFDLAASDSDVPVQAQAIRAIGDLTDPILKDHCINSGPGDHNIAERIAKLSERADPRVVVEALIVMRRLRWPTAPEWIASHLSAQDPALDHAAQQALRNASNWPAVVRLLDEPPRLRKIALHAIAEQRVAFLADQLIERLQQDENPEHRREYADALSRIVRETEPWTYWGFRPAPRPPATVDWEKTAAIETALNSSLLDSNFDVRSSVLGRMLREGILPTLSPLAEWLSNDASEERVNAILESLKDYDAGLIRPILTETALRIDLSDSNRLVALSILVDTLADDAAPLIPLAEKLQDGPVLAFVLREFGLRIGVTADDLLIQKLDSKEPVIRAEAIRSLAKRDSKAAVDHVERLLGETDPDVRLAAAEAAGRLGAIDTKNTLLDWAAGSDLAMIAASLESLRQMQDSRAVTSATNALKDRRTQSAAIDYLNVFGTPDQIDVVVQAAAQNPASEFQYQAVQTLSTWQKRFTDSRVALQAAIAAVHGRSGQPLVWNLLGPLSSAKADRLLTELKKGDRHKLSVAGHTSIAEGAPAALSFPQSAEADSVWLASTSVRVDSPTNVEILTSATGLLTLWLNGEEIHARGESDKFQPDSDRVPTNLDSGTSLLVARIDPANDDSARFHLRFRRRSSKAEHERLVAHALRRDGDVNRGRAVFANVEKSSCIRCHRLGAEGGRIGPDLTGIGNRFSRIHLIESILEPSRTVAPSYSTIVVALKDGKVMSGIRVSESNEVLVLGDNQGKLHEIAVPDIDEIAAQTVSTMPEGLEKKLTDREFTDLLAFLESEKSARGK